MKFRLFCLAALGAVLSAVACSYPQNLTANSLVSVDTLSVFALSGSPPSLPSGLDLFTHQPVRVDGSAGFDVAFDIASPTQVRVLPVKLVVSASSGVRSLGLQHSTSGFDQLASAPSDGYQLDSAQVVNVGDVLAIRTSRGLAGELCAFSISPFIYAKVAVLSIDVSSRVIMFQMAVDPNCGFRSLLPGLPTN